MGSVVVCSVVVLCALVSNVVGALEWLLYTVNCRCAQGIGHRS